MKTETPDWPPNVSQSFIGLEDGLHDTNGTCPAGGLTGVLVAEALGIELPTGAAGRAPVNGVFGLGVEGVSI